MCWDSRSQAKKSEVGDMKGSQSKIKTPRELKIVNKNVFNAIKNNEESKFYVMPKLCYAPHIPKFYEGGPPKQNLLIKIVHLFLQV